MKYLLIMVAVLFCGSEVVADKPIDFAFGENGCWAILYESGNQRIVKYGGLFPADMLDEIKKVPARGRDWTGMGFDGKAGWVIASEDRGRGYFSAHKIYKEVGERIKAHADVGWLIKDVALTPNGGYIVIYGQANYSKNGYVSGGDIPKELADILKDKNVAPIGIGITSDSGWGIVYTHKTCTKWHYQYMNIPQGAADFINEKFTN